ncbi:Uncharacterised protein [Mycobacteroides abscessus subsp. abscessus]|nr:Uncharacterised protein [Mycobacteroides abscessus subsp. abscessus]
MRIRSTCGRVGFGELLVSRRHVSLDDASSDLLKTVAVLIQIRSLTVASVKP